MESSCDDARQLHKALSPASISTRFTLMMQEGGDCCDYSMVKTLFEAAVMCIRQGSDLHDPVDLDRCEARIV